MYSLRPDRLSLLTALVGTFMVISGLTGVAASWFYPPRNGSTEPDDPCLQISHREYDLGSSLQQNQKCTARIQISNAGHDSIRILRFETDCGCTLILPERKELAPGQETSAEATVNLGMNRGDFARKCAIVYQHDHEEVTRRSQFVLSGHIIPEFDVSPTLVSFDRNVEKTEIVTFTVNRGSLDARVTGVSTQGVTAERLQSDNGKSQQISITFHPDRYHGAQDRAKVYVDTGNTVQRDFSIEVVIR